jgi:hypothetical protein
LRANSSLAGPAQTSSNATELKYANEKVEEFLGMDREKIRLLATNVFKAHKQAIEDGIFDWSEAAYLRYALGYLPPHACNFLFQY